MADRHGASPPAAKQRYSMHKAAGWAKVSITIAVVLVIALLIYRFWDVPILADLHLQPGLSAGGWVGREAADNIVSRANVMVENSRYGFDVGRHRQRVSDMQYLEQIKIPKFNLSLREAIWVLDRILLHRSNIVDADVGKSGQTYTLSMTNEGNTKTFATLDKEKLLCQGANYLLLLTEPYVLAAGLFNLEKAHSPTDYKETTKVLDQMIQSNGPDLIYAYTLRGNILTLKGDYDEAHAACERAIAIDPSIWVGHACIANAYATESLHVGSAATPRGVELCRMADAEFSKAESQNHPMNKAYHLWSVCKDALGDGQAAAQMRRNYSDAPDFVPKGCPS